jgi:hypothetical protein
MVTPCNKKHHKRGKCSVLLSPVPPGTGSLGYADEVLGQDWGKGSSKREAVGSWSMGAPPCQKGHAKPRTNGKHPSVESLQNRAFSFIKCLKVPSVVDRNF